MTATAEPDLDRELRKTLTARVGILVDHPDPWTRYRSARRRHRQRTLTRRSLVAMTAIGAVVAVMTNVVPVPSFVPVIPVGPASDSPLMEQAPAGSLAGDRAWLDGLRATVSDLPESEGVWRVAGQDRIKVVFAGDVGRHRVALLAVPLRLGVVETWDAEWYSGPANAVPSAMRKGANGDLGDVATWMEGDSSGGDLVVVAPTGSTVQASLAATFGADGRIHRRWDDVPGQAGAFVAEIPGGPAPSAPAVRVRDQQRIVFDRSVESYSWSGDIDVVEQLTGEVLQAAMAGARGPGLPTALARTWVRSAVEGAGLGAMPIADLTVRIPWTGQVAGDRAAVVTLQPRDGGVLVFALRGTARTYRVDLRLLTPAPGASTRPVAYRLRAHGGDRPAAEIDDPSVPVVVIAPNGAARAELVVDGMVEPITLRPDGSAELQAPRRADLEVRAYDEEGTMIGTTPVAPLTDNMGDLPGADRATRLVD